MNAAPYEKPYSQNRFYRNKQDGKFMGVCAGLADFTGIEAVWWRIALVVGTFMGLGFLPLAYIVAGFVADKKPTYLPRPEPEERQFQMKKRRAPQGTIRDVHARFRSLDRRLSSIEKHHTMPNTALAREIDSLK
jgi:phage shock protein C